MNLSTFSSNFAFYMLYRRPLLRKILQAFLFLTLLWSLDRGFFIIFNHGLKTYYGFNKEAQILCLGHSHTVLGIDAGRLERALGVPVAKYAITGANTVDRLAMLKHYLSLHPHVKLVTYDVDTRLFDSDGLSAASYSLFLPFMDEPNMSHYLRRAALPREYSVSKLIKTARFRDQTLNLAIRGLLGRIENEKRSTIDIHQYQHYFQRAIARGIQINQQSVYKFYKTINYLSSQDIKVILVYLPVIDILNKHDKFMQEEVIKIFERVEKENSNVYFIDYNKDYSHQHNLFFDPRHLNYKGKRVISSRLSDDIHHLFKNLLPQRRLPATI